MPSLLLKEVEGVEGSGGEGGAGLAIGDYVQTERTELEDGRVLLPVQGQLITSTYPLLEAELPDRSSLTSYSTVAEPFSVSTQFGFCSKADGTKSWAATSGTTGVLYEIDNVLQTSTLIYTPAVAASHSLTAQCSNDGTKLYFLHVDDTGGQDIFTLHYSHDSGSTWSTVVIYDALDSLLTVAARIECSGDGVDVKIMLTSSQASERDFIRVFTSSDSGVTFTTTAEQDLGAVVYTSEELFISKDLTTLGLRSETNTRWLSTDGGSTFTEETQELLGPSVLVTTETYTAISSDGSTIISCPNIRNLKTINISTDGMSTWTTLELEISKDYLNEIQCLLSDPTDPNVFYILQSVGNTSSSNYDSLYKLDVSTGTLEYVSNIPKPSVNSLGAGLLLQQVSKAYVNGSDTLLSFADYSKRGYSSNLTLSKGKYLPTLDSKYKIVADAP